MGTLVLLRHGESEWNSKGLFTGWVDVGLAEKGRQEAAAAGRMLVDAGLRPDVVHTSVLTRAISTANVALEAAGLSWLPVSRSWRLNERHYGALQGKDKAQTREEFGDEQFMTWRRSYDVPPPPLADDDPLSQVGDARYATLPPELMPRTECLRDVVARMLPYWYDAIVPDFAAGRMVLVVAHGNSLRGLVKHLDGISDTAIPSSTSRPAYRCFTNWTTRSAPRCPAGTTSTRRRPPRRRRLLRTRAADVSSW